MSGAPRRLVMGTIGVSEFDSSALNSFGSPRNEYRRSVPDVAISWATTGDIKNQVRFCWEQSNRWSEKRAKFHWSPLHSASSNYGADDAPKSCWWCDDAYTCDDRLAENVVIWGAIGSMHGVRQLQCGD